MYHSSQEGQYQAPPANTQSTKYRLLVAQRNIDLMNEMITERREALRRYESPEPESTKPHLPEGYFRLIKTAPDNSFDKLFGDVDNGLPAHILLISGSGIDNFLNGRISAQRVSFTFSKKGTVKTTERTPVFAQMLENEQVSCLTNKNSTSFMHGMTLTQVKQSLDRIATKVEIKPFPLLYLLLEGQTEADIELGAPLYGIKSTLNKLTLENEYNRDCFADHEEIHYIPHNEFEAITCGIGNVTGNDAQRKIHLLYQKSLPYTIKPKEAFQVFKTDEHEALIDEIVILKNKRRFYISLHLSLKKEY